MTLAQNSHLTYKANAGVGRHGWLRLTPAYSVALVRQRISLLEGDAVVLDPFSGTGTTPLAAAEHGVHGQSLDVNPFLIWLGRAKTRNYDAAAIEDVSNALEAVLTSAHGAMATADLWQPLLFKIEKWWPASALQALRCIRYALDMTEMLSSSFDLLSVAFCRSLIKSSNAAFNHQSMSFKTVEVDDGIWDENHVGPFIAQFEVEAREIIASAAISLPGSADVILGDARNMPRNLQLADLLLTSPPYVNRMSYIRELRPYMYWLRFLEASADAGELDWKAIGGTWGSATSKLGAWRPSETGTPIDAVMDDVRGAIANEGGKNGPTLSNYVGKYFHDMWEHFQSAAELVKPGGTASYIVGNSSFYGNLVPAQDWYAAMLREAGFVNVRVDVIRKRNSNKQLFEYDVHGQRSA